MGYSPLFETNPTGFGTAWVWEKYARKHLPIYIYPVLKITLRIFATIETVHHWPRDEMPHRNLLEIRFNPHNLDLTSKKNYESIFLVRSEFLPCFTNSFMPFTCCLLCWCLLPTEAASVLSGSRLFIEFALAPVFSEFVSSWQVGKPGVGSFVLLYVKLECQLLYSNPPKNAEVGIFPLIYSDKLI